MFQILLTSSFSDSHSRTASGFLESSQSSGSFAFPSESAQSTCRDSLNNPAKEKSCVLCFVLFVVIWACVFEQSTALAKYFCKQTKIKKLKVWRTFQFLCKWRNLLTFVIILFMRHEMSSYNTIFSLSFNLIGK